MEVSIIIDIIGLRAIDDMVDEISFAILAPIVDVSYFLREISF